MDNTLNKYSILIKKDTISEKKKHESDYNIVISI